MNRWCEGSLYKGSQLMCGWLKRQLYHDLKPIDSLGTQSSPVMSHDTLVKFLTKYSLVLSYCHTTCCTHIRKIQDLLKHN